MKKVILSIVGAGALTLGASANTITYSTASGASDADGSVDATATFVTSANQLTITLTDLQANPTSVGQLISGLTFSLSGGQTSGTLVSSTGTQISVGSGGTYIIGSTGSTGWGLNNNISGGLQLDALGYVGPAGLIIGNPDGNNLYSNANGSIAGNKPHNPFLYGPVAFILNISGLDVDSTVTGVTFDFGTTAGSETVPGVPNTSQVPDGGSTVFLLGAAISGLTLIRRKLI